MLKQEDIEHDGGEDFYNELITTQENFVSEQDELSIEEDIEKLAKDQHDYLWNNPNAWIGEID